MRGAIPAAQRHSQPQQPARIDWSNPLTRGLVDVIDMTGPIPRSVILKTPVSSFGTRPGRGVNQQGRVTDSSAAFGGWYFQRSDGLYTSNQQTHVAVAQYNAISGNYAGFFAVSDGTGANTSISVQAGSTSIAYVYYNNSTRAVLTNGLVPVLTGNPGVFVVAADGANLYVYENGVYVPGGGGQSFPGPTPYSTSRLILFGERAASASYSVKAKQALHLVYNRALSAAEVVAISENPWQIFTPARNGLWVATVSSGITGTISDTQGANTDSLAGTVSVSGTIADTQAGNIDALSGSVVVSGALSETQQPNTDALSGTVGTPASTGTIADVQQPNTDSISGTASVSGTVADTQASDISALSGSVSVVGTVADTQAPNTDALSGQVLNDITGTIADTQQPNTSLIIDQQAPYIWGGDDAPKKKRKEETHKDRRAVRRSIERAVAEVLGEKIPEVVDEVISELPVQRIAEIKEAPDLAASINAVESMLFKLQTISVQTKAVNKRYQEMVGEEEALLMLL